MRRSTRLAMIAGLGVLAVSVALLRWTGPSPAGEPKAPSRLCVVWSSGDPGVAKNVCLMYAHNAKRRGWFDEVHLIVWGPSDKLLTENQVGVAHRHGLAWAPPRPSWMTLRRIFSPCLSTVLRAAHPHPTPGHLPRLFPAVLGRGLNRLVEILGFGRQIRLVGLVRLAATDGLNVERLNHLRIEVADHKLLHPLSADNWTIRNCSSTSSWVAAHRTSLDWV